MDGRYPAFSLAQAGAIQGADLGVGWASGSRSRAPAFPESEHCLAGATPGSLGGGFNPASRTSQIQSALFCSWWALACS